MRRIRVLVVDDSVVVRHVVSEALEIDPAFEVVGVAANGRIALAKVARLQPDAVTLDVEMPELDGVATARELRAAHPDLTIVMYATPTERTAHATLEALSAGADDYVAKPVALPGASGKGVAGTGVAGQQAVLAQLAPRLKALTARRGLRPSTLPRPPARPAELPGAVPGPVSPALAELLSATGVHLDGDPRPSYPPRPDRPRRTRPYGVLLVGSSTGGPEALARTLPRLPASLPVPVVVVQHMPAMFTAQLAARLDSLCALDVREAVDDELVAPGTILIAPGGRHLGLRRSRRGLVTFLDDGPQENFCRPAVDVLFRTAVSACHDGILAVVLTGMGRDGERGARLIQEVGGTVFAQDEATSVVWGMPGSVVKAGLADRVLPLREIGTALAAEIASVATRGATA